MLSQDLGGGRPRGSFPLITRHKAILGIRSGPMCCTDPNHCSLRWAPVPPGHRLARRREVYTAAREANPSRWRGRIRRWSQPDHVALNKREEVRKAA